MATGAGSQSSASAVGIKAKCSDYTQDLALKMGADFENLAKLIGLFMEYWGFKKIHGQIWTHIFLSEHPIDATTLSRRLKVSKALMSLAIKDLVKYRVIQASEKGHKRTIYFRANPNIMSVITEVLKTRERKMLEQIQAALKTLVAKKSDIAPSEKLEELESMILDASDFLDVMITTEMAVTATPKK